MKRKVISQANTKYFNLFRTIRAKVSPYVPSFYTNSIEYIFGRSCIETESLQAFISELPLLLLDQNDLQILTPHLEDAFVKKALQSCCFSSIIAWELINVGINKIPELKGFSPVVIVCKGRMHIFPAIKNSSGIYLLDFTDPFKKLIGNNFAYMQQEELDKDQFKIFTNKKEAEAVLLSYAFQNIAAIYQKIGEHDLSQKYLHLEANLVNENSINIYTGFEDFLID